jgi:DHA1 family tetracycline resistance protein-like MFS transporter
LAWLSIVTLFYYLAHQALPSVFVLYTEFRYGWNEQKVGLALAIVGVCAAIVSGGLVGPYVKKFGERFSLWSGLFYGTLGFLCFGLAPRGWEFIAAIPFIALWGVASPAMQSLMSQRVDPSAQGKLQGALNSLRALTGMAGPLLFTQVFSAAIAPGARLHIPGAPYLLASLLLFGSLLLAFSVVKSSTATVRPATGSSL